MTKQEWYLNHYINGTNPNGTKTEKTTFKPMWAREEKIEHTSSVNYIIGSNYGEYMRSKA